MITSLVSAALNVLTAPALVPLFAVLLIGSAFRLVWQIAK